MHRYVVPTQQKLAASERSVRLLPSVQADHSREIFVECGKAACEQNSYVNAFGIIVELAPIYGHARSPREGLGQSLFVKEILNVVIDSAFNRFGARRIFRNGLDLGERLQNKTGVEVIDKKSRFICGIRPRTVCILRFDNKIEISIRDLWYRSSEKSTAAAVSRNAR